MVGRCKRTGHLHTLKRGRQFRRINPSSAPLATVRFVPTSPAGGRQRRNHYGRIQRRRGVVCMGRFRIVQKALGAMLTFNLQVGMTSQPCEVDDCDDALPPPPETLPWADSKADPKADCTSTKAKSHEKREKRQRFRQEKLQAFLNDFHFKDVNSSKCFNQERLFPIHLASMMGDPNAVSLLKAFGADVNKRSSKGRNALDFAKVAIAVLSEEQKDYHKTSSFLRYCHVIELLEVKTLSMRQFLAGNAREVDTEESEAICDSLLPMDFQQHQKAPWWTDAIFPTMHRARVQMGQGDLGLIPERLFTFCVPPRWLEGVTAVPPERERLLMGAFEHSNPSLVAEPLRRLPARVAIGPRSLAATCCCRSSLGTLAINAGDLDLPFALRLHGSRNQCMWRQPCSTLPSLVLQSLLILLLFLWSSDCGALRRGYILDIMNEAPTGSGSSPLQEYRREIPPGWQPNDPQYPLRSYFDRLRLWYRIANLPDEAIGPTIAGRLYGRAHRVAMSLRVPRPDGGHDTGDAALVRLEVDEVRDPKTGVIIQHHVPSGVQHLTAALRMAFGQQDQDLATQSPDKFFGLARGRLSLQEYSVEFDARFDEASDRAGLQMNEVARFFLFFKNSGLSTKQVDDIKLQVAGDFTRFAEARALAPRLSSNKQDNENMDNYYAQDYFQDYDDESFHGEWMDEESYSHDDYDHSWWADYDGYYDEGEWVLDYDDGADAYYQQFWDDEHWSQGEEPHSQSSNDQINNDKTSDKASEQPAEEYYGGKGQSNDGCFVCGYKWHRAKDCPMSNNKGFGKGSSSGKTYAKGKGKPGFSGEGKGKFWRWRPFRKGKGKGKGHFGRGKYGGGKGCGKRHWFAQPSTVRRGLDIKDGIPDGSTRTSTASASAQKFVIHTPPSDHDNAKFVRTTTANTASGEEHQHQTIPQSEKKHLNAFSFTFNYNYYETAEYFAVRGEKRRGLIIDPGAASGLIGCDTLKDLIEHCIKPYGKEISIDKSITSPVRSLEETAACPALVGSPSLRKMNSTIFTNKNGDGLLVLDSRSDDTGGSLKMLRILLTDSGHYILPTVYEATAKVSQETQQEVAVFWNKVAAESCQRWTDVNPKRLHVFHTSSNAASYAEGDRGEASVNDQGALCHDDQQLSEQPPGVQLPPEVSHDAPKDDNRIQNEDEKITGKDDNKEDAEAGNLPTEPSADDKFHNDGAPTVKFEDTRVRESHDNNTLHYETLSTVCTDEKPCGFTNDTKDEDIPHFHTEEDFPAYKEDMLPDGHDVTRLRKKYRAMPEEYYTRTGLKPVTPKNFPKWFMHAKGKKLRLHFWEVFSGSGRLSLTMLLAGLTVGFPIDMRYGWDVGNACHQKYLRQARDEFCPGVIHLAPECGPWSVSSSSKDPDQRQAERLQQKPSLDWTEETCHVQSKHGRGYVVEQPWGSALWQPDTPLDLTINEDNRKRQRVG
eukprot:s971_g16.t1